MVGHILKSHNKNLVLYHFVFPVKYRQKVFTQEVELTLKTICIEIGQRYEIHFIEIGMDEDHAHFLIQSVPMMYIPDIVKTVKSITAREIFMMHPEVKRMLWGGHFWTAGYYVNTVGAFATEQVISKYVRGQGKQYKKIYSSQLKMFEGI